jgi:Glycosyl transferase family 2
MTDFAVIIAAYEAEGTVGEAIESALAQTHPAAEIVVCDDGSKDGTAAVVAGFGERVTLVRQENQGAAAARNTAIAAARSEFVVNLDADDLLDPANLAARAALLAREPDLDIVVTDGLVEVDGVVQRRLYGPTWTFETEDQRGGILERCFITFWALRRERFLAAGGFDPQFTHAEDWECFIRMILGGSRAGLVEEPLGTYRLQQGSLSNQTVALQHGHIEVLRKTAGDARLTPDERERLAAAIAHYEGELRLAQLREAVLTGGSAARAEAWKALRRSDTPAPARAKAALAVVWPGLARRVASRRGRETGAGVVLPVE